MEEAAEEPAAADGAETAVEGMGTGDGFLEPMALTGDSVIVHQGEKNGIIWTIDSDGLLTISGSQTEGSGNPITYSGVYYMGEWQEYALEIKSVVVTAKNVTSTAHWFFDCIEMTAADFSDFDTSNVTNMRGMFEGCTSLASLAVSGWDTGKVTDMSSMFSGCTSLASLDLSGWDTGKVTDMGGMFSGCSSLESLAVSGWDTGKVTYMSSMFEGCTSLEKLDLSGWNAENVTSMYRMFYGCSSLTSVDVSGWNTENVTDMGYMFSDCRSLASLDVSGWKIENVTNMSDMFSGCTSLSSIKTFANLTKTIQLPKTMKDEEGTQYTDFPQNLPEGIWLYAETPATSENHSGESGGITWAIDGDGILTISGEQTGENPVSYGQGEWREYRSEIKGAVVTAKNVTSTSSWFSGCDQLTSVDFTNFDTSQVKNMSSMFQGCSSLTSLDLSDWNTENVTSMYRMFYGCSSLTSLDVSGWNTENVANMSGMFYDCSSLTDLNISGFDTAEVKDMSHMFTSCNRLKSLDLSGWDTTNVTDMTQMFQFCRSLTNLNVTQFKTANVTRMYEMFGYCRNLTDLNISGFDTTEVKDMSGMFDRCARLSTLDVTGFKTDNVTDMQMMFYSCSRLTSLDLSGWNTANVTDMSNMFGGCSSLTSLDVSGWNQDNVTNMTWMFEGCSSLTSLDLSDWNTENVTDMSDMFEDCSSLTSLNLSGWNTENVRTMSGMFGGCSSLTSLDVSGFDTSKVTNASGMFNRCTSLEQIKTFANLTLEIQLPKTMCDENGTEYTAFPQNLSEGIWLYQKKTTDPEPEDPTDPDPSQPTDPTDPDPSQPTDPTDPDPSTPTDPVHPAGLHAFLTEGTEYAYTGKALRPAVEVWDGSSRLEEKTDYTLTYKDNTKAGTASVQVKGKGSYGGSVTLTFTVLAIDLSDDSVLAEDLYLAAGGGAKPPAPVVSWQGKKLAKDKDFTVAYLDARGGEASSFADAGDYTVRLTGKGNFTGTRDVPLHVTAGILLSQAKIKAVPKQTYTGRPVEPKLTVTLKGKALAEGTDYTVSYRDNFNAGTATAVITGKGDYAGTKAATFRITGLSIAKATVTGLEDKVYNGKEQTQKVIVTLDGTALTEGTDYEAEYAKNANAGTATLTLRGKGSYTGTLKKKFKIAPCDLSEVKGFPEGLTVPYAKGGSTPVPELTFNGGPLTVKKDYTVSYKNNKKLTAGGANAVMTVKGKGNFKGSRTLEFTIVAGSLGSADSAVTLTAADAVWSAKAGKYRSKPVLTDGNGKKLKAGTDYEKDIAYTLVSVGTGTAAGTGAEGLQPGMALDQTHTPPIGSVIKVTVTGKGNYTGTMEATYRVAAQSFSKAKPVIAPQEYTGGAVTLKPEDVSVTLGGKALTYGTDYEIVEGSYRNNQKKGTASVTLRGLGDYAGSKTVKFRITARQLRQ